MIRIGDEDLKKIELDILKYVRDVCDKYQLTYYLGFGTLLGAVRHKGFIPWDDDIDIWMPRKDYDKFIEIERENRKSSYKLFSPVYNDGYYYPFVKVVDIRTSLEELGFQAIPDYGVCVDIFPLDSVPKKHKILLYIIGLLQLLRTASVNLHPQLNLTHKNRAVIFRLLGLLGRCFFFHKSAYLSDRIARLYSSKNTPFIGDLVEGSKEEYIFDKRLFEPSLKMKFENELFIVPRCYDVILTQIYGDYMTLPQKEKRVGMHLFKAYYKDKTKQEKG
ncbi:LicD family protein [Phocaeicola sp.]